MSVKMCVLQDNTICTNCGRCLYCDLDPKKICDNCCRCLDLDTLPDYKTIEITEIQTHESDADIAPTSTSPARKPPKKYRFKIVHRDSNG